MAKNSDQTEKTPVKKKLGRTIWKCEWCHEWVKPEYLKKYIFRSRAELLRHKREHKKAKEAFEAQEAHDNEDYMPHWKETPNPFGSKQIKTIKKKKPIGRPRKKCWKELFAPRPKIDDEKSVGTSPTKIGTRSVTKNGIQDITPVDDIQS